MIRKKKKTTTHRSLDYRTELQHLAPGTVVRHTVYRQSDHLHTPLLKLLAEPSGTGQLGRAHRSEITWVREQDAPSTKKERHTDGKTL